MFSFEPIDRCIYNGIEYVDSCEYTEQRFVLHFGDNSLDNKFFLVLSRDNIRLFYYDSELLNYQGILYADLLKELGCISLTHPKDTGNDILHFPQMACGSKNIEHNIDIQDNELSVLRSLKELLYSFPFWQNIEGKEREWQSYLEAITKCCFLIFVFEIEDRSEKFAISPLYDHVRDRLRESDVYKLLCAKLQYTLYVPQNGLVYNSDEYSYKAKKIVDVLIGKNINKIIPPEYFTDKKNERQSWFYDPEKELEYILKKNRDQNKENADILKEIVLSKIRSFLYSRHAVDKAQTYHKGKVSFGISQLLMLVGNIIIVTSALFFKNDWVGWYYGNFWVIPLLFFLVTVFTYISGNINKNRANVFFPRILVAEAAAWLTIGIAEDLIKSMLWIDAYLYLYVLSVLGIVGLLIYGEAKQHSPYLRKRGNIWKTSLILNHSLFFALSFGCAMQLIFYDNLLENSDALSSVVYKNHFGETSSYLQQLENLEESIKDYEQFAREYELTQSTHHSINKNDYDIKGIIVTNNGDSSNIYINNSISFNTMIISSLGKNLHDYHDKLLINTIKDNIRRINDKNKDNIRKDDFESFIEHGEDAMKYITDINHSDSINMDSVIASKIKANITWMYDLLPSLKKEIIDVKKHLMDDDYNTLIEWATYKSSSEKADTFSEKGYLGILVQNAQEKKCCRIISGKPLKIIEGKRLFPNLLLVHTLIVLILAFITQLIISNKSVTEPL